MSQPPSADQPSHTVNPSAAPVAVPGFEAGVQAFWEKNRSLIQVTAVAVLLAIVGREGWQYLAAMRERDVQEDYAKVADKPDKLAAFAAEHASHTLAGVAYLQMADQAYEAGDFKLAAANYAKATGSLTNEVLLGRARLGAAMSQISGGDKQTGEAALKVLGADQALLKTVRAEATYHLALLAYEAGRTDDVKKLVEEVSKIDLTGAWSQRATLLLASLPSGGRPGTSTPAITFKPTGG